MSWNDPSGEFDWDAEVVPELVPLAQSAPPHASPEYEEIPEFPPRLSDRNVRGNGRLKARGFFLTYSQTQVSRDRITQWFSRQNRMKRVVVGQEHHQDGHLHWHVTIEYEVPKDLRAQTYFDIDGEHPNIGIWSPNNPTKQTYENWFKFHWDYCKKEDQTPFIVGEEPKDNRKRKRNEIFTEAIELARLQDVKAGMEFLEKNAPYDLLTKYEQIHRALVRLRQIRQNMQAPARAVSEFPHAPLLVENWRVLYLNGPTGRGKTQWARSLLPEATLVSHRDQLRDCDFSKGIIFDDFDVSHWPPTAVIHLLDWDEPRGLDVKHGHVVIPAHTRKIFTHNREFERWLSEDATDDQVAACRRRIHVINIHVSLY